MIALTDNEDTRKKYLVAVAHIIIVKPAYHGGTAITHSAGALVVRETVEEVEQLIAVATFREQPV